MASGTFMMDPTQLQQSGARFQECSNEYTSYMTMLRSTIEDLGTCWKSEDYNQFVGIYQQNAETIDQMSKAFASFGEILTTTGSSASQISADLKTSFR